MTTTFSVDNTTARTRLIDFARRLTDSELAHPMPAGWTVSAVLAHLAFWDIRASVLLEKWAQEGIGASAVDTDVINEVSRPLCLAIPPREAVELAVCSAERIDGQIERLTEEQIAAVAERGTTVHLNRARHRLMHLDDIAAVLGKPDYLTGNVERPEVS